MKINADFDQRAAEHAEQMEWIPSPMAGVSRKMLDRIGGEVARATSIVRYDAGSHFSPHVHSGGEEFIVLDGVFQDEHGDFPVGTYVRNPINTAHTPASAPGCQIFVKLWQFDRSEQDILRIDTQALALEPETDRPGVASALLFQDARETVKIQAWKAAATVSLCDPGGVEVLVLEGGFTAASDEFRQHSWLRLPKGEQLALKVGPSGARVWTKSGHLRFVTVPQVS